MKKGAHTKESAPVETAHTGKKKKKKEEEKRAQMIEAKKETASLEKLREQKLDAYNKAVQKSEEAMIDELVSRARAVAAGASA